MRFAYLRPALVLLLLVAATLVPNVARSQSQTNVFSLFPPSANPGRPGGTDQLSVELGLNFSVDTPGAITAIRFYKAAVTASQHTVSLWAADGTLIGRTATISETSTGWQQATFGTPITLVPGASYVASYHTNGYAATQNYFTTPLSVGPLHAPGSAQSSVNGLFVYASDPVFPTNSYLATNYWVDVVFVVTAPTPTPTSTPTNTSQSTATPMATSTATVTATATRPSLLLATPTATSTPVPGASSTPMPTATSTPVPGMSSTATPTATATATRTALGGTSTPTPTPMPPASFMCTEIVGFSETEQWYDGGFISSVPNPWNWQLRWYSGGSIDQWARGASFSGWGASSLVSHCANFSSAPDRVILNVSGDYNTDVAWWARQTQAVIDYVRTVYSPNVKLIVLQPVVGGPASSLCGNASNPPTSWVRASYNFPAIKAGLQQVLSSSVLLGADPQVRSCADYVDTIGHLAPASQQPIGAAIAGYYSQPPR